MSDLLNNIKKGIYSIPFPSLSISNFRLKNLSPTAKLATGIIVATGVIVGGISLQNFLKINAKPIIKDENLLFGIPRSIETVIEISTLFALIALYKAI